MTRTALGTHRVELWDNTMPVAWLGNFTRAATRHKLDIIRGSARRNAERWWSATFELRSTVETEIKRIDFLALTREAGAAEVVSNLELEHFELSRSAERANVLSLRIQARDKVGFLASLLAHLAGFVLFPEEIRIDTHQNQARDALWLSAVGGMNPAPEIERALEASLRECIRNRAVSPRL